MRQRGVAVGGLLAVGLAAALCWAGGRRDAGRAPWRVGGVGLQGGGRLGGGLGGGGGGGLAGRGVVESGQAHLLEERGVLVIRLVGVLRCVVGKNLLNVISRYSESPLIGHSIKWKTPVTGHFELSSR